jgi:ParB family transcriptional regulator, chromosome partitioning protein
LAVLKQGQATATEKFAAERQTKFERISEVEMENTGTDALGPKRRSALGKGIESLLGPRTPMVAPAPVPVVTEVSGKPLEIALELIEMNPNQPRTAFDVEKLEELAASIRASGVVQPIVVRELPEGKYQLIAGERRWRASGRAGKATIPAFVREVSDEQAMEMTIVENLQRADLNPMEQARAFEQLGRDFKMTQEQIALRTGKDRASVGNFLRLLRLPVSTQEMLETGVLSFGHARALLSLGASEKIAVAAERVKEISMSVRQTEMYVQDLISPEERGPSKAEVEAAKAVAMDPNVKEAQEMLQRRLGLRVKIEDKRGRGRVIIEYSGVEDFDALLGVLGEGGN